MTTHQPTIGFIGAGNMGRSIIEGLIRGTLNSTILVHDRHPDKVQDLVRAHKITLASSNLEVCNQADIIILAVKPQSMKETLSECLHFKKEPMPLFVSVAAGITIAQIRACLALQDNYPVVRAMPNTPATIQQGSTGLYGENLSPKHIELTETIMRGIGSIAWIDQEPLMDVVTALSGSGPAYFFYFCEHLISAAVALGLPEETAKQLALDTGIGALAMAKQANTDLVSLRTKVTSPGGTTEAGLKVFQSANMQETIFKALQKARDRGQELSQSLKD